MEWDIFKQEYEEDECINPIAAALSMHNSMLPALGCFQCTNGFMQILRHNTDPGFQGSWSRIPHIKLFKFYFL